jgi:hypothetical protein
VGFFHCDTGTVFRLVCLILISHTISEKLLLEVNGLKQVYSLDMMIYVTSVSQAVMRSSKRLATDKELAKAYQKTLQILGEGKA